YLLQLLAGMTGTDRCPIVFDTGSRECRFGLGGMKHDKPRYFYSMAPRRTDQKDAVVDQNDNYISSNVHKKQSDLPLVSPIERGVVINWDDMEKIWHHAFYDKLSVAPEEHPVVLTEPPLNPKANRETMAQVMFETFNVPSIYIGLSPIMALYANCLWTGIVLESGDGISTAMHVYDNEILPNTTFRLDLAGRDLTDNLAQMLNERGYSFTSNTERKIVRDIKEKLCYVAMDFEKEMQTAASSRSLKKSYKLPDGRVITIGNERFRCAETLFQPSSFKMGKSGIQQILISSILTADEGVRDTQFQQTIVLTGGSMRFKGTKQRLQKELAYLAPPNLRFNILAPTQPNFDVWFGASKLPTISFGKPLRISKTDYEESGPTVAHIGAIAEH
ncbi:hypothetical protein BOX15_Mlig026162g2, partial [Macrostomum lignano]